MTTVKVASVTFVRYKQLKGGKKVARNIRTISTGIKTTSEVTGGVTTLNVEFDTKYAAGKLEGSLIPMTGHINLLVVSAEPRGYMKHRNFELVGYKLDARMTNENRRKEAT